MDATPSPVAAAPLIEIRNVSRRYVRGVDEVHALEHVTLSIPAGHFVGFMGPSGSGKSTLLNLVSGIDRPSEGEVIVADQRLNDLSEDELARWRARHVGQTVVMVTHDPRALRFVDDAHHLDKGVLLEGEDAARAREAIHVAAGGTTGRALR